MAEVIPITSLPTTQGAPFKRLRMKHRRIIALHMQGLSGVDIAKVLGTSSAYVSEVLRNDSVRPLIEAIYREYEHELRALFPLTVERLRSVLRGGEDADALRAIELWHKIHGTYERAGEADKTAEDVIEMILEKVTADGSKLTVRRRVANSALLGIQKSDEDSDENDHSVIDLVPAGGNAG